MRILALESSAKACSAAILENGFILGEGYLNTPITHSNTLLTLAAQTMDNLSLCLDDIDAIAVAAGPGSFTGVRIGVAAAKGLAWGRELPLYGVSTVASMAQLHKGLRGIICPCMDARRDQIYNALFFAESPAEELKRLCDDRAISAEALKEELLKFNEPIYLVGEGACIVYEAFETPPANVMLLTDPFLQEHASGTALEAYRLFLKNADGNAASLIPNYIRPSQAERVKAEREGKDI